MANVVEAEALTDTQNVPGINESEGIPGRAKKTPHVKNGKPRGRPPIGGHKPKPKADDEVFSAGDDFWMQFAAITDDQWQWMIVYLWRTSPITDRKAAGKATSIGKITKRFDIDHIKHTYGSGGYRLDLCKMNPANTKDQKRICQYYFFIEDLNFPPRVPFGDWLNDGENKDWEWARPALQAQHNTAMATANASGQANIFKDALEAVKGARGSGDDAEHATLATALLEMVTAQGERMADMTSPLRQMEFVKMLKEMNPPAPPAAPDRGLELIIAMLRDDLKEARTEAKEARQIMSAPRRSFFEEFMDAAPQLEKAIEFMGYSKRGPSTRHAGIDWGNVLDRAFTMLPGALEQIAAMNRATAQQPRPAGAPGPAIVNTPPQVQQSTPEENSQMASRQQAEAALKKHGALLTDIAPRMLSDFDDGKTGYEFRDWFLEKHGMPKWDELKLDIGAEHFAAMVSGNAYLAMKMKPADQVAVFFQECFTEPGKEPPDSFVELCQVCEKPIAECTCKVSA